jgi:7,8-dihydroneopterin aldolase/epimerase/oxygenase
MIELHVQDIEFFGGHGVFPEERLLKGRFLVDVVLQLQNQDAFPLQLGQTIDYQEIVIEVKDIMQQNEGLLENLAWKIHQSLKAKFSIISYCRVKITKWPQVGNKVGQISVCFDGN